MDYLLNSRDRNRKFVSIQYPDDTTEPFFEADIESAGFNEDQQRSMCVIKIRCEGLQEQMQKCLNVCSYRVPQQVLDNLERELNSALRIMRLLIEQLCQFGSTQSDQVDNELDFNEIQNNLDIILGRSSGIVRRILSHVERSTPPTDGIHEAPNEDAVLKNLVNECLSGMEFIKPSVALGEREYFTNAATARRFIANFESAVELSDDQFGIAVEYIVNKRKPQIQVKVQRVDYVTDNQLRPTVHMELIREFSSHFESLRFDTDLQSADTLLQIAKRFTKIARKKEMNGERLDKLSVRAVYCYALLQYCGSLIVAKNERTLPNEDLNDSKPCRRRAPKKPKKGKKRRK